MDFTELKRALLQQHLRKHIAGEVRFDNTSRRLYSTDASIYQIQPQPCRAQGAARPSWGIP